MLTVDKDNTIHLTRGDNLVHCIGNAAPAGDLAEAEQ